MDHQRNSAFCLLSNSYANKNNDDDDDGLIYCGITDCFIVHWKAHKENVYVLLREDRKFIFVFVFFAEKSKSLSTEFMGKHIEGGGVFYKHEPRKDYV